MVREGGVFNVRHPLSPSELLPELIECKNNKAARTFEPPYYLNYKAYYLAAA